MPKCEIFDLFDFHNFCVMNCLFVWDLGAEINFFLNLSHLFIFASVCAVYAGNDF